MSDSFYAAGLRFSCRRCSRCCRHEPGYVFLTREDLERLAQGLGLPQSEVLERHCRVVRFGALRRISLRETPAFDCILWGVEGCRVYSNRPLQCRSFPFWAVNLASPEDWEQLKRECPGVGSGNLHSAATIQDWLRQARSGSYL
jgi:Fe-S-cluster containining protein